MNTEQSPEFYKSVRSNKYGPQSQTENNLKSKTQVTPNFYKSLKSNKFSKL